MRYPDHYAWLILASTLDILVTHTILHYFAGSEVNLIANALIQRFGLWGMVGLKYICVIIFVVMCEFVGHRNPKLGLGLTTVGIVLSALPVGIGLIQIFRWTHV